MRITVSVAGERLDALRAEALRIARRIGDTRPPRPREPTPAIAPSRQDVQPAGTPAPTSAAPSTL